MAKFVLSAFADEASPMLDEQIKALQAQLVQKGLNLEMYCQFMKSNEEKLREDARANAIKSLRGQAAIELIVELEHLEVTEEEREAALIVVCRQNNMDLEQLKPYMDEEFEAAITRSVLTGKVMRLIRDAADIAEV